MAKKSKRKSEKFLKLNAYKLGLAGGIVTSFCVFISTIIVLIFPSYGIEFLQIIDSIYGFLGYRVSFVGAILGAVYGFFDGFIFTWIFARIYNNLL